VQYCLLSQTPVYVYDHFGGPGYLTDENYTMAKHYNFSGRGFTKKTDRQIVKEIKADFSQNQKFLAENYEDFLADFSLEQVLPKILIFKNPKKNKRIDSAYANSATKAERLAINYFRGGADAWYRGKELRRLEAENSQLREENAHFVSELEEIRQSRGYKLLNKVARVKNKLRKA